MAAEEAYEFLEGETPTSVSEVPSYFCDLNLFRSASSEPWRIFGNSTRTNLRRSLRDLGALEVDWADDPEMALALYDEMVGYHQTRWQAVGKPGVFSSDRFRRFHHDLIETLVPQQRAALIRVRQGTRVLGILYLLIEQNRLWYYQSGLPDYQSKLGLGNVTQYMAMLEGARRGYNAFDFLAGDGQHKRVLSTHHNVVYWIRWRRPSLKFRLLDGLRSLRRQWPI
jgi:CelD/BcsL family acetyltransferase involved in cellulose biosynthesis